MSPVNFNSEIVMNWLRWPLASLLLTCAVSTRATQESGPILLKPFEQTPEAVDLDPPLPEPTPNPTPKIAGPIAPAGDQPPGALAGRIIYTSGGHGWCWYGSYWSLGRGVLNAMNEDYGNVDQMTLFVYYCFNAGATVVPLRPVGNQTNEVVVDNTSPTVTWNGVWENSSSGVYFGPANAVPYRYANSSVAETATATYTPNLPAAGFYPVYTWVYSSANRGNQLYRIRHTGGESRVRIPHHMVGNGWVYLGTYYFNAGASAIQGAVVISNLAEGAPGGKVVIADAIRFGNGMGDVDRGGGISTYPREEECSRYWIQRALGQGQPASIYDGSGNDESDNVGAPIRMAREMNREAEGNMYKRVYLGFHSNATTGNPDTATSRGVLGLYNNESLFPGTSTSNQFRLAQLVGAEINSDLLAIASPPLELGWYSRSSPTFARSDYAFGEIRGDVLNYEMDATIIEVAFHDNISDAKLLRDPKVRNWMARASYQAIVRYMNEFDGLPLVFLPEPPVNVRARALGTDLVINWSAPIPQGGSGAPTNYVIYTSTNGYGFGNRVAGAGAGVLSLTLTNLAPDTDYYFRVAAVNAAGESLPSETVGCRRAGNPLASRILVVNGFTRFDRNLNLRQTPTARQYKPPGHNANTGTMERILPRQANSFDYVVPHGKAIAATTKMGFDSCQIQAATNGMVNLADYDIIIWACGNQSTADRTFNSLAQARLSAFLGAGGRLFVSGSEIGWDLDRASGPSVGDRNFLRIRLHASLNGDANDNSGIYSFSPTAGSLFSGNLAGTFDDGSKGIYWVGFPDALTPVGQGARAALQYPGYAGGAAGIAYDGSAGGGKVVYWGFPFETIPSETVRNAYLGDVLRFLSRPVRLRVAEVTPGGQPRIVLEGEPGLTYTLQRSSDLVDWTAAGVVPCPVGEADFLDTPAAGPRFYRAVLAF